MRRFLYFPLTPFELDQVSLPLTFTNGLTLREATSDEESFIGKQFSHNFWLLRPRKQGSLDGSVHGYFHTVLENRETHNNDVWVLRNLSLIHI